MSNIISNENGVIWVKVNDSVLGIVSSLEILDCDGLKFTNDTMLILESRGAELEEDFANETTTLNCENGRVVFSGEEAELIQ